MSDIKQKLLNELKEQEEKEAREFQKMLKEAGFMFDLKTSKAILEIAHDFLEGS